MLSPHHFKCILEYISPTLTFFVPLPQPSQIFMSPHACSNAPKAACSEKLIEEKSVTVISAWIVIEYESPEPDERALRSRLRIYRENRSNSKRPRSVRSIVRAEYIIRIEVAFNLKKRKS